MKQSGFGVASLILGIIGMLLSCVAIGIVPCVIGLILAIIGIAQKDRGHGTAIGGLVCSVIGIGIFLFMVLFIGASDDKSTVSNVSNVEQPAVVSTEKNEEETNNDEKEEVVEAEEDLASQMEITEYSMVNSIGDTYYIMVVKNNSSKTVELNVNATAKDADGNTIGATSSSENAVGSGREVCILNYFDGVKDATEFEYTLSVKEDEYYEDAVQDLEIEESKTDEKVILTVTNNGSESARFVEAQALFFQAGELVFYDSAYITDDESEIKAGAMISNELNCYKGYDEVKVFITGRR